MTSFTDAQAKILFNHLTQAAKMVEDMSDPVPLSLDYTNHEEVSRHVTQVRMMANNLSLHLFRTFDMMHKFSQANWPRQEFLPHPQSRPTVDDL